MAASFSPAHLNTVCGYSLRSSTKSKPNSHDMRSQPLTPSSSSDLQLSSRTLAAMSVKSMHPLKSIRRNDFCRSLLRARARTPQSVTEVHPARHKFRSCPIPIAVRTCLRPKEESYRYIQRYQKHASSSDCGTPIAMCYPTKETQVA